MIGRTVSHYRIEEKIGEGGMGVVYRATDTSLNRSVAVKFLAAGVGDEERRRRFLQEAQTASSLNHPHILTVYEAGTFEGRQYLVTEFIDGPTLREWAAHEPRSLKQIVELATGIADALACAHQAGITHRDVKPENILLSSGGYAKLVDFGLAKLREPGGEMATRGPSAVVTRSGVVMGTTAYMSPEQTMGKTVDASSDVFSFGVVLYELLTGHRPFLGKTDVDVMHAILHSDPAPVGQLRPDAPHELRTIVEKALEKEPSDRYQAMREVVVDLKRALRHKTSGAIPAQEAAVKRRRPAWWPVLMGLVLVLLAVDLGFRLARRREWRNPLEGARFTRLTDFEGAELDAAISADGKFVAFLSDRDGQFDAWVGQIGSGEFLNLTKSRFEDLYNDRVRNVGFSADATQVWIRRTEVDVSQRLVQRGSWFFPTTGGAPRRLLELGINPVWSPDGRRLLYHEPSEGDPTFVADPNGANPSQIFSEKPPAHAHFQTWSPDGRYIYFVRGIPPNRTDIWRMSPRGENLERITQHDSRVGYPVLLDSDTLVYAAVSEEGSGPWLYGMDLNVRKPYRLTTGVQQYISAAASGDGRRLVVTEANPAANLWTIPLSDRVMDEASAYRLPLPTARALAPRFGPGYLVFLSSRGGTDGVWKFKDDIATELWKGSDGVVTDTPAISPDGGHICFLARKDGKSTLYVMTADGTSPRPISGSLRPSSAPSWSPDGKWIAVVAEEEKTRRLFNIPLDGGTPIRLSAASADTPLWSPDGKFLVYSEPVKGQISRLRAVTRNGEEFAIPHLEMALISRFRFHPDAKSLVLLSGDFRRQDFWRVDLQAGARRQLTRLKPGSSIRNFDISPDGKQIIFDRQRENSDIVLIERAP